MKIAFVTDDEQALTAHFGQAPYVVVATVEDGVETAREVRERASRREGCDHEHGHHHHGDHGKKFEPLRDCEVLIVRGMGSPAFERARSMGLQVFLTREKTVDAYLAGELDHDERRIHYH